MSHPFEPVANGISLQHLGEAMRALVLADVEFGTILAEEGSADATLMYVLAGEVEAVSGEIQIATAEPGAMLGTERVFGGRPWPATFKATKPSTLLLAPVDVYERLRTSDNPLAWAIERAALAMEIGILDGLDARIASLAEGAPLTAATHATLFGKLRSALASTSVPVETRAGRLRASEYFRDGDPEAVTRIAERMVPVAFDAGSVVTTHGQPSDRLFFVAEGRVDVVLPTGPDRFEPLATLEAGALFGMASLLDDRPHTASVLAHERVVLYALEGPEFRTLMASNRSEGSVLRRALLRALAAQNHSAAEEFARLDRARKAQVHEEVTSQLYQSDRLGEVKPPDVSRLDKGGLVLR